MDLSRRLVGVTIGAFSAALALAQSAAPPADAARLLGLWGTTRSFGPEIRGELSIARAGDAWRATIGGTSAPVRMSGDSVTFTLAANLGSFRGHRDTAGSRIPGHWLQPARAVTGVSWATPVDLRPAGLAVWRGKVAPLEE